MAKSDADIEKMRQQVAEHDAEQAAARAKDDAERALVERDAVQPLTEFVESDVFTNFVKRAEEINQSLTGQPLIQHLVGAMTSLTVVQQQVGEAKTRYEAAEAMLKGTEDRDDGGDA